jgi:hypothetical protein
MFAKFTKKTNYLFVKKENTDSKQKISNFWFMRMPDVTPIGGVLEIYGISFLM